MFFSAINLLKNYLNGVALFFFVILVSLDDPSSHTLQDHDRPLGAGAAVVGAGRGVVCGLGVV
jgi:hypothetical protein